MEENTDMEALADAETGAAAEAVEEKIDGTDPKDEEGVSNGERAKE